MLIGVLVLVWIVVLSPLAFKHYRERQSERSIVSFHERMAKIGTGAPLVAPAHRLDVSDEAPPRAVHDYEVNPPTRVPRLRVVPDNATVRDLELEQSWEEWSLAHSDDPREVTQAREASRARINPRAAAYSRVPASRTAMSLRAVPEHIVSIPASLAPSARQRRRRTILQLSGAIAVTTLFAFFTSILEFEILAVASWMALAGYLGLMYYAMTQGLIPSGSTASLARSGVRVATAPTYRMTADDYDAFEDDGEGFRRGERYAEAL
jgi:hypothetical protein